MTYCRKVAKVFLMFLFLIISAMGCRSGTDFISYTKISEAQGPIGYAEIAANFPERKEVYCFRPSSRTGFYLFSYDKGNIRFLECVEADTFPASIRATAVDQEREIIYYSTTDGDVLGWSAKENKTVFEYAFPDYGTVEFIAYDGSQNRLAFSTNEKLIVYDLSLKKVIYKNEDLGSSVDSLAWDTVNDRLVCITHELCILDMKGFKLKKIEMPPGKDFWGISLIPQSGGTYILCVKTKPLDEVVEIVKVNLKDGSMEKYLSIPENFWSFSISPDGKYVYVLRGEMHRYFTPLLPYWGELTCYDFESKKTVFLLELDEPICGYFFDYEDDYFGVTTDKKRAILYKMDYHSGECVVTQKKDHKMKYYEMVKDPKIIANELMYPSVKHFFFLDLLSCPDNEAGIRVLLEFWNENANNGGHLSPHDRRLMVALLVCYGLKDKRIKTEFMEMELKDKRDVRKNIMTYSGKYLDWDAKAIEDYIYGIGDSPSIKDISDDEHFWENWTEARKTFNKVLLEYPIPEVRYDENLYDEVAVIRNTRVKLTRIIGGSPGAVNVHEVLAKELFFDKGYRLFHTHFAKSLSDKDIRNLAKFGTPGRGSVIRRGGVIETLYEQEIAMPKKYSWRTKDCWYYYDEKDCPYSIEIRPDQKPDDVTDDEWEFCMHTLGFQLTNIFSVQAKKELVVKEAHVCSYYSPSSTFREPEPTPEIIAFFKELEPDQISEKYDDFSQLPLCKKGVIADCELNIWKYLHEGEDLCVSIVNERKKIQEIVYFLTDEQYEQIPLQDDPVHLWAKVLAREWDDGSRYIAILEIYKMEKWSFMQK